MGKEEQQRFYDYWVNRSIDLSKKLLNIGDEYYEELAIEFQRAQNRIEKEIQAFYGAFATNNKISYHEAKKILTTAERKRFMMDVNDYIQKGQGFPYSEKLAKQLANASNVHRVTRLQALQIQMQLQVNELYSKYDKGLQGTAETILNEGYYRSIYDFQKEYGLDPSFSTLDTETVKNIVAKPWAPDGTNFSSKIWSDREKLTQYLQRELSQAFIRGESPDRMIKEVQKLFHSSSKNAARLVQTESSYFSAMSKLESYKALGYKKYMVVAVMDEDTSPICREMDGEVFDLEDFMPGITANPFHPRCRTTTAPYEGKKEGAKAPGLLYDHKNKKMYSIPEDMTYKEWYKEYVENREKDDKIELSIDEERAVNRYISSEAYELNEKLRNHADLTDDDINLIDNLSSALDKMPDYEGLAVRTLDLRGKSFEKFLMEHEVGKVVTYPAFSSFSTEKGYNDTHNVEIYINSQNAKDIRSINMDENEVLYKTNSSFEVISKKLVNSIYYILLEEYHNG